MLYTAYWIAVMSRIPSIEKQVITNNVSGAEATCLYLFSIPCPECPECHTPTLLQSHWLLSRQALGLLAMLYNLSQRG